MVVHTTVFQASGATLNKQKRYFSKAYIKFLGHIIGLHPDPNKIQAIVDMKSPQDISEVRNFLGMVHQMTKFSKTK